MHTVYICDAVRTPFGRYGGALAAVRTDDLAAIPIAALLERNPSLDGARVDDVIYGCANQAGEDNRNVGRMALLLAGLPKEVPGSTVNRLCGSSLDAVVQAARAIGSGEMALVIAGGVESMSRAPYVMAKADAAFARGLKLEDTTLGWRFINPKMHQAYGTDAMGETARSRGRRVARRAGRPGRIRVSQPAARGRGNQRRPPGGRDRSRRRPAAKGHDPGRARRTSARRHHARGARQLKPIIKPDGTVTAGNASGINDGACAVLLASEAAVKAHGLTPRARYVAGAVAGVAPRVMGIGPVPATRKVLAQANLTIAQMDVIELNEAFAAQALAVLRDLGVADDAAHVNPNGGAIAIGHPLGASGARLVTTATYQLARTKGRYALCTMCIGVGQGISVVIERL